MPYNGRKQSIAVNLLENRADVVLAMVDVFDVSN